LIKSFEPKLSEIICKENEKSVIISKELKFIQIHNNIKICEIDINNFCNLKRISLNWDVFDNEIMEKFEGYGQKLKCI
jgi:hypothetical protein